MRRIRFLAFFALHEPHGLFVHGLVCGHQRLWVPKKDSKLADMSLKKLHADVDIWPS
ncbi:hypothetical protein ALQ89_100746 [Pseudomonas amygdali pv. tabaci]|uniref:Uncharacterized protein n=2 Tax=Pseudomonas amygdali TaxID=47877 RepID=A0A0Q0H2E4_PSEAJ|nr:hypothetical protein ALO35_102683 [Pseudomonas amygdali pv. lachrymans]KPY83467.1 hypothetical protein ALO60_102093 [Pseudomonas amygdali pv. tabaci]RML74818.1 hypothetical protein ALQ89_100746 [Pseudomonas amygdali pv. tabaci]RMR84548.1 hypothetical protein ALP77_101987 [Pseudomonas amygdali pv. tabaci]RMW08643.1 hypothetical protein ALP03_102570 [Pseudomonas amygdali pv. tabaci]